MFHTTKGICYEGGVNKHHFSEVKTQDIYAIIYLVFHSHGMEVLCASCITQFSRDRFNKIFHIAHISLTIFFS
jgi:hypothetical protein